MKVFAFVGVLMVSVAACSSSSHRTVAPDAAEVLRSAARKSAALSSATLAGAMLGGGKKLVLFDGVVDFAGRRDSITLRPAPGVGRYPPFDVRLVDGWTYIEIDAAVDRPPTLHADTAWVAFHQRPTVTIPVPDRALPPQYPIDAVNFPLAQPMLNAHFLDPAGTIPRRVSVRFAKGEQSGSVFTFSIDAEQRIVEVLSTDVSGRSGQGTSLKFAYRPDKREIVAPTTGVQTVGPHEQLYPTPTTAGTT